MALILEERRLGIPRTDLERIARHWGVSLTEAELLSQNWSLEELLPPRGTGGGPEEPITGHSIQELGSDLTMVEDSLPHGGRAALELCTESMPTREELDGWYQQMVDMGFHVSRPQTVITGECWTTVLTLTKGSPVWAALIPLIPTILIVGLITFGIFKIREITNALMPILLVVIGGTVILVGLAVRPAERVATKYLEAGGRTRYIPSTIPLVAAPATVPGIITCPVCHSEKVYSAENLLRHLDTFHKRTDAIDLVIKQLRDEFPQMAEALDKLKYEHVVHIHDDGDLTLKKRDKLYVVTTLGEVFEQKKPRQPSPAALPQVYPGENGSDLKRRLDDQTAIVRKLWAQACSWQGVDPHETFVELSEKNPYGEKYNRAIGDLLELRRKLVQLPCTEQPAVFPREPERSPRKKDGLEYLADSPEFLARTIDMSGWREKLNQEFQAAVARTRK